MRATVTAAEIARARGITERAVQKMAKQQGWPYAPGRHRKKKFVVDELPEEVRIAVEQQGAGSKEQAGVSLYNKDTESTLTLTLSSQGKGRLVCVGDPALTEKQNRIALARADLIKAYLAEKTKAKQTRSATNATELFIKGYNAGLLPDVYAAIGPAATRTVERWVSTYKEANSDYRVLAPLYGNHLGQRKITSEEFNCMLSFALHPNRLCVSEVVRLTKMALEKRTVPSPSSPDTLRRALCDWKKANYDRWIFSREGEKALTDKCLPYLERDASLLDVGDVLVADGHTLNFLVLHPFTGKPTRMSMVTWYDWASCYAPGWEIMPTENVQCVAAGLRRAILRLGKIPKVAYLDNGKAFKAKLFTDENIDFEQAGFYGMFARLGIETLFAWPYNAQSKPVERFFETFGELERLMPTYSGTDIEHKPAHMLRNERLHKQLHEKRYGGWVPTIEEATRIIEGWMVENSKRPHTGLSGLQPADVFEAGKGPGVDERALRHMMMSLEVKQIQRNGIHFMQRFYYDDALYGYRDRVLIRYDLEDLSKILVYDKTGARLLCEATPLRRVHPIARIGGSVEDLEEVKERIRQKRALKRSTVAATRAYIAEAPALIEMPRSAALEERAGRPSREEARPKERLLTPAEAEKIEADAAEMKVLTLRPKEPDPLYMNEPEKYEHYLERQCKRRDLTLDEMSWMRWFETTSLYKSFKARFDFLWELWLTEEPEKEAQ